MRKDIKKVICEKERKGDRGHGFHRNWKKMHRSRNAEDHEDVYMEEEFQPKHESLTKRLMGEKRQFSENLGAVRGLVRKALGKQWDDVYSELCKMVSPTGTNIERHVHQHLPDFIALKTRMNGDLIECYMFSDWTPVDTSHEFYVHPETRIVCQSGYTKKNRRTYWKDRVRALEQRFCRETADPTVKLFRIGGIWYRVLLGDSVLITEYTGVVRHNRIAKQIHATYDAYGVYYSESLVYGFKKEPKNKKALNKKELTEYGLDNVSNQAAAPLK
jgi:hypothetical protein